MPGRLFRGGGEASVRGDGGSPGDGCSAEWRGFDFNREVVSFK